MPQNKNDKFSTADLKNMQSVIEQLIPVTIESTDKENLTERVKGYKNTLDSLYAANQKHLEQLPKVNKAFIELIGLLNKPLPETEIKNSMGTVTKRLADLNETLGQEIQANVGYKAQAQLQREGLHSAPTEGPKTPESEDKPKPRSP